MVSFKRISSVIVIFHIFAANVFVGFLHIDFVAFFLKEIRLQFYLVLLNNVKIFPFCYISLEQKELQSLAWKITLRAIYPFTRGIAQFEDVLEYPLREKYGVFNW